MILWRDFIEDIYLTFQQFKDIYLKKKKKKAKISAFSIEDIYLTFQNFEVIYL